MRRRVKVVQFTSDVTVMYKGQNRRSLSVERKEFAGLEMAVFDDLGIVITGDGDPRIVPWAGVAWFTPLQGLPAGAIVDEDENGRTLGAYIPARPIERGQLETISNIPAVRDRAGVGDGSVADAVTAVAGALECAERDRADAVADNERLRSELDTAAVLARSAETVPATPTPAPEATQEPPTGQGTPTPKPRGKKKTSKRGA